LEQRTRIPLIDQRRTTPVADILRTLNPEQPARSLYIHVPFCYHKCHYCDFYSIVDTQDRQSRFLMRLQSELQALSPFATEPLDSIFVGGGTPSLLQPRLWAELLETLQSRFDLSRIRAGSGEFTVECNPETVTSELASVLFHGGVNRVSMGAQSFNPKHLQTLERHHDPEGVIRALELTRAAGISRDSIDLIYAIPGQTLRHFEEDLERAIGLNTSHLSCYNLTYEPNTAMHVRLGRGEFTPVDEDVEVDMFLFAAQTLKQRGFQRYEVSNYARPGMECRHNLAYWRQHDWLAAGPSASAHMQGHRWKNVPRLDDYLDKPSSGASSATDHELPDERRALGELLMTGLRLSEGLDAADVMIRADRLGALARVERVRARQIAQGLMHDDDSRLILTDEGILVENRVTVDFLAAIDPA